MPDPIAPAVPRRLARRAGTLAAALLLTLTACGGDEADTEAGGTTTAQGTTESTPTTEGSAPGTAGTDDGTAATSLTATAVDFAFDVPQTEFPAGPVTIELTNEGSASHDLTIEDASGNDVAKTDVLQPGGTGTVEANLTAGEYVFYCSVGNHRQMGMEVRVTVT